jgi:N-acetylmuramoyl-L-alanine amidase
MIGFLRASRLAAAVVLLLPLMPTAQAAQAAQAHSAVVTVVGEPDAAAPQVPAPEAPAAVSAAPAVATAPVPVQQAPLSLAELVARFTPTAMFDESFECLATAIYFEARGESLEGQLAVADVVLNRTASAAYPNEVCAVVKQKAQFSFVRRGQLPRPDEASEAWRRAVAVAFVARNGLVRAVPDEVLWYHADYVSPSWGRRLTQVTRIGAHIFYS